MLVGRWPRVTADGVALATLEAAASGGFSEVERLGAAIETVVADTVRTQAEAGLDLVNDGDVRWPDPGAALLRSLASGDTGDTGHLVRNWLTSSALTEHVVAQVLPGPYTLGRTVEAGVAAADRREFTLELADRMGGELVALTTAGCAMVVVEE
ncbi:MAG TPA: hypothetical protein VGM28_10400, partial [Candidatus Limnocylindrales bacterium]